MKKWKSVRWMGVGQRWDGPRDARRLRYVGAGLDYLEPALPTAIDELPRAVAVLAHSSELALATTGSLNSPMLECLTAQVNQIASPWAGEHFCLNSSIETGDLGYNFAPILDDATVEATIRNVHKIQEAYGRSLVIEEGPRYFPWGDQWDDLAVLLQVARATGCGILLDVSHHVVSMLNLGRPLTDGLSEEVLEHTVEVHLTSVGQHRTPGFYHDWHSGPVPDVSWRLLAWALPKLKNLKAVTLEHDHLVDDGIYACDLDRLATLLEVRTA